MLLLLGFVVVGVGGGVVCGGGTAGCDGAVVDVVASVAAC